MTKKRTHPKRPKRTREVEYYRLWPEHVWDTDWIDIPADTPDDRVDAAIREAVWALDWRDGSPVIVGCYADADED